MWIYLGEHYSVYLTYTLPQLKGLIEYFKLWPIRLNSGVDLVKHVGIGVDGPSSSMDQGRYWQAQGKALPYHSQKSESSGWLRLWFLASGIWPLLLSEQWILICCFLPVGNLKESTSIWLINLHNISEHPVKLSKGTGKGNHNFPYFTDKGDCDREVVQLSSLMSCGERQKKDRHLRKNPSILHPLHHYFAFTTSWLRIFKNHGLGFLAGELATGDVQAVLTCVYLSVSRVTASDRKRKS